MSAKWMRWASVELLALLALAGCERFKPPAESNRSPFIEVQLVIPSTFPVDRIASAEIVIGPASGSTNFFSLQQVVQVGDDPQGRPYSSLVRRDPEDPSRIEMVIFYATSPFRDGERTVTLFLYPQAEGDGGLTGTAVVRSRLLTSDGRLLASGEATRDTAGQPIEVGRADRTVQLVLACDPSGACTDPPVPVDARITVTRAPACPTTNLSGRLFTILFPVGPNAGEGQLFAIQDNADFTAPNAQAVIGVSAPPGAYALLAILDVGNDLPLSQLSPQRGDVVSVVSPLDIFDDRLVTRTVVLESVVGIGSCTGGRSIFPPTLTETRPASPSSDLNPVVRGTAQAGTSVTLHTDSSCSTTALNPGGSVVGAAGTFAIPVTVASGSTTTFFARAEAPSGQRSVCSPRGLTFVHDVTPPSPPTTVAIDPVATTDSSIRVTYGASSGDNVSSVASLRYEICVTRSRFGLACQGVWSTFAQSAAGATSAIVHNLTPNTQYFVFAAALDEAGNRSTPVAGPSVRTRALSAFRGVVTGRAHTCAIASDSSVHCFGRNDFGQLGNGTTTASSTPVQVSGLSGVIELSAGVAHTCALTADRTALCWGANDRGQLGDSTMTPRSVPVQPLLAVGAARVRKISAGAEHTCASLMDGTLWCWGQDAGAQLGNPVVGTSLVPVQVLSDFAMSLPFLGTYDVVAGASHTCAIHASANGGLGDASCWGTNDERQFGGFSGGATQDTPLVIRSGSSGFAAGAFHTCYQEFESIFCFGRNSDGQLGIGTVTENFSAFSVRLGQRGARAMSTGRRTTCAVTSTGELFCFGANDLGQIGDGTTTTPRTSPQAVLLTQPVAQSATSGDHGCALTSAGELWCWGRNDAGQLGDGTQIARSSPAPVANVPRAVTAVEIAAGGAHVCVRMSDGTARCWGENAKGQLGDGTTVKRATPAPIEGLSRTAGLASIAAGPAHTCVVTGEGRVRCFGAGTNGELGAGVAEDSLLASNVLAIDRAIRVVAGENHTCALLANGQSRCWGSNADGRLGAGPVSDSATPLPVSVGSFPLGQSTRIATGRAHGCTVHPNGGASCWGSNSFGQLGDPGAGTSRNSAGQVFGDPMLRNFATGIAAGGDHTCLRTNGGRVGCWGRNDAGQLGDGTTTNRFSAVAVPGLTNVVELAAGTDHSCALLADGSVRCWGANAKGQLGNGTIAQSLTPFGVLPSGAAIGIATGDGFTCRLLVDGAVECWGKNDAGQLGVASPAIVTTPVRVSGLP
jgi:alpha-tubulin suppressor-like RCC1 family protein